MRFIRPSRRFPWYGIMERAKGVLMLEGDFGWNDVGSWDTLDAVRTRDAAGNISSGDTLHSGCEKLRCIRR